MSEGPISPNQPVERDPIVSRALRTMPVPDHQPGFWAELEARLADVHPGRSGQQQPDPATSATDAGDMPSRGDAGELPMAEPPQIDSWRERRIRQRRLLLRVAALLLLTAAGAVVVLTRSDDRNGGPAERPDTTTAVTPVPTTTVSEPPAASPEATVREFVGSIGRDRDAAFAMLTDESREFMGNAAQLAAGFGRELSVWSAPGAIEQQAVMVARSPAAVRVAVVTYTGTLDVQGAPEPRTQAFAVLREAGEWRISLTATALASSAGPAIEMINPSVEPEFECCGVGDVVAEGEPIRFRAAIRPERRLVSVAFDGREALAPAQLELTNAVVTARPRLDPGPHVVTIAVVLPDGVVYARAVHFVVG